MTSSVAIHSSILFFFNDTATTEIYTLSLHDALPISERRQHVLLVLDTGRLLTADIAGVSRLDYVVQAALELAYAAAQHRSEEHTSELQSQSNLVCRLLLEKKKKTDLYSI